MNTNVSFEEVLVNYEPIIKKQMISLRIYKDFDEFFQLGRIALWEAYMKFDPAKGSFSTYAISTIRGKYMTLLTKKTKDDERQVLIGDERFDFLPSSWEFSPLEQETIEAYMTGLTKRERVGCMRRFYCTKRRGRLRKVIRFRTLRCGSGSKGRYGRCGRMWFLKSSMRG